MNEMRNYSGYNVAFWSGSTLSFDYLQHFN